MKKHLKILFTLIALTILAACQAPAQTAAPAASDTAAPPASTFTAGPTLTPTFTPEPTETLLPTWTPAPSLTPSPTPPTYVREGSTIPVPNEPITAENAAQIVELARLGKGAIQEVQLSPNRVYLLVRTTIGIYGYRADTLEQVWAWEDPAGIATMAVPKLDRWIAAATNDGRIALLIYQRGSMFSQIISGYESITGLAFSADGDLLAAIGDQGVKIWQVGKTKPLYEYPKIEGEKTWFTPDGENFTFQKDDELTFVEIETGEIQNSINLSTNNLAFTTDRQRFSDFENIWDANTGEKLIELETPETGIHNNTGAFSQNGQYLAMVAYPREADLGAVIWQAETGKIFVTLKSPLDISTAPTNGIKLAAPTNMSGPPDNYTQITFSPDGRLLAASHSYGFVDIYDMETNYFLARYSGLGTHTIFRKASRLTIWDNLEIHDIEPHNQILINSQRDFVAGRKLNFSPDSRWLFADWAAWDLNDLERAFRFGNEIVATISPNGEFLYSYDWYQRTFYQRRLDDFGLVDQTTFIWDFPDSYTELNPFIWGPQPFEFSISPNGNFFSISAYDIGNRTWDTEQNELIPELHTSFDSSTRHRYSSDGKILVISEEIEEQTYVFQLEPKIQLLQEINGSACGISPDGHYLVIKQNRMPFLYSMDENGKFTNTTYLDMELKEYYCVSAFLEEEIAAGASWTEATLTDLETGNAIITLPAHLDEIADIAFSPDGKYMATSSYDGTVKIWGIPPE